jgi:L-arabinonolactonase
MNVECVVDRSAELGECPLWSSRESCLYWIDIDSKLVHRYDPRSGKDEQRLLPGRPGSLALTADPDRLLVAVEHDLVDMSWSSGTVENRAQLEPASAASRLNDGRCDPAGRFWVGSMTEPLGADEPQGALQRYDPDGSTHLVESGVGCSNGLAFSSDGAVMYWTDTTRDVVWAYDYDLDTGTRSKPRAFLEFATLPGRPDGACVDESGCYWIACVDGWALLRATPTGEVDRIIDLPIEKPTMPAFGGPDLDTLYVTSIGLGGSVANSPGQPQAGGLFALSPGVRGLPEPHFAG